MRAMTGKQKQVKLIIADDSQEFIEGFEVLVSTIKNLIIIGAYQNGKQLIQSKSFHLADIVLIDIEMPIINGIEAAKIISKKHPYTPLIALTMHIDKVYLEEMIKSGFKAFIHKPKISQVLYEVISKVLENKYVFPHNINTYKNKKI